jgi:hypothetical protein
LQYTIRKREDADNVVNIYSPNAQYQALMVQIQNQGTDILIPNDLTDTTKKKCPEL